MPAAEVIDDFPRCILLRAIDHGSGLVSMAADNYINVILLKHLKECSLLQLHDTRWFVPGIAHAVISIAFAQKEGKFRRQIDEYLFGNGMIDDAARPVEIDIF